MTKKKQIILGLVASIVLVLCILLGSSGNISHAHKQITTPTIFVHGWGSSYHAEDSMAQYARRHGASNSIIRANVSSAGQVTLIGKIRANAKNPIVEVNLLNNKSNSYEQGGNYVWAVVRALQQNYRFNKFNLVGHSMGNLQITYYLKDNLGKKQMPQLNKLVSIAGHYNGFLGETAATNQMTISKSGRPHPMIASYQKLLRLRQTFPRQAAVLNIYGNLGNGGDGSVGVNSARSYRYLVKPRARSYQEKEITGKNAQHSRLHENPNVDRLLVKFLWQK